MILNLTFDPNVSAAAQATVNAVKNFFENQFTDNITLNITVQFGAIGGLGQSGYSLNSFTYAQIRNALIGDATTTDDTTANNSLPVADPNPNTHTYYLLRGEQKALGLLGTSATSDGTVTFSNAANTFDFDRSNGITAGLYDFAGVVSHEFTEVMGRAALTGIGNNAQTGPANGYYPFDLFHWSAPGVRDFSGTTPGYFSIDSGNTNLGDFNTNVNGDWGDWASSVPNDAFDAFSNSGVINEVSQNDLRLMDVLGYNRRIDDWGSNTQFFGNIAVNGGLGANINYNGDHDWFNIQLIAGHNYIINEHGVPSGGGTLTDAFLRLQNSGGTQVAFNDDGGTGLDSQLAVHVNSTGFYFVDAGGFNDARTGTYTLDVQDLGTSATRFQAPLFGIDSFGAGAGGWSSQDTYPRAIGNVADSNANETDLADIVGFGSAGTYISRGTGGGSFGSPVLALAGFGASNAGGGWTSQDQYPREVGNVGGLGPPHDDIVGFGSAGTYVALSNGNLTFGATFLGIAGFGASNAAGGWTSQDQYPRVLGDVNGDGFADIVGFGSAGTYVALSNGNGTGTFGGAFLGIAAFGASAAGGGWSSEDQYPRFVADVNGDHRADIVGFGSAGVYVSLASGGGGNFAAPILAISGFGAGAGGWTSQDQYPRELADVNGDGRADIVAFGASAVYYALGQTNGTFGPTVFTDISNYGTGAGGWTSQNLYPRLLGDVTGDQRADIVGFGSAGVYDSPSHDFLFV